MAASSSEMIPEIYNYIKKSTKSGEVAIKSMFISLIVYYAKEFFKHRIFVCPIQHYSLYGNLFIYGPAVVLFCISLLVSENFWHLTTGFCRCRKVLIWYIWNSRKSVFIATLLPLVWLIVAFADAQYYICSKVGSIEKAEEEAKTDEAKNALAIKISNVRMESQVISWALLVSVVVLTTVVLTINRFFKSKSHVGEYEALEMNFALQSFKEKIKPLAELTAKAAVDKLFEHHEDKSPRDVILSAKENLVKLYPQLQRI